MIVLDTNVLSELAKPQAEAIGVAWADAQFVDDLYATTISEAKLLYGLALMAPGRRKDDLRRAIETAFATLLAGRVLPFDRAAAQAYAELAGGRKRRGKPVGIADLQIAAIARARGAGAIATRDVGDFEGCDVPVINPWAGT
jgi:predicted nucleic acid-binding protein